MTEYLYGQKRPPVFRFVKNNKLSPWTEDMILNYFTLETPCQPVLIPEMVVIEMNSRENIFYILTDISKIPFSYFISYHEPAYSAV